MCLKQTSKTKKKVLTSQRNLPGRQCEMVSNSGFYFLAKSRSILVDPFLYTDSQEMAKTRKKMFGSIMKDKLSSI